MNFEQNLFISYAHIDDQPLAPGEKGWITRFHATLKAMLSMRMGLMQRSGEMRNFRATMFFQMRSSLSSTSLLLWFP
jgi:hypothetical protein